MKTILPFSKHSLKALVFAMLLSSASFSQTIPELVFANPVLESGNAGEDGAKYRFNNVAPGLDAVVEITGRSGSDVVLSSIDSPDIGWDKAFQPMLGIPGTAAANQNWWMKFRMTFYNAGTNTSKTITKFYATGIDIDGDGQSVQEWVEMDRVKKIDFSSINSLSDNLLGAILDLLDLSNSGEDHKIEGPVANYANIDTNATNVMATYEYEQKDKIDFTIGAKTGSSGSTAAMRMNSIWFKQFDLTVHTLPVKLISFSAMLIDNKAAIKWVTASEMNVSHFEIEKSFDGKNFNDAGMVFAYGNTNEKKEYSFSDNISSAQSNVIYYRLRSVDIDGKSQYSETRIIRIGKQTENAIAVVTYPNPVSNELRVTIPSNWQNKKVTYEVFNNNGQVSKKSETANSSQTENLNVSSLAPGFYIVKVTCDGQLAQQKIVKQ